MRACCSPLGSSAAGYGAVSWVRRCLLVFQGARGHPRHPGILLQLPAGAFPPRKIGEAPVSPGRGFPVLGALAPALALLLTGPLPLGCLLFLYFFFPRLPTLIEARTLLTVALKLVSL